LKINCFRNIEKSDILITLGLVLLGVGLWMIKTWMSLVVIGIIILLMGFVKTRIE